MKNPKVLNHMVAIQPLVKEASLFPDLPYTPAKQKPSTTNMADDEVEINGNFISLSRKQAAVLGHDYDYRANSYIRGSFNRITILNNKTARDLLINGYRVYTDDMIYWSKSQERQFFYIKDEEGKAKFVRASSKEVQEGEDVVAIKRKVVSVYTRTRRLKDNVKILPLYDDKN